MTPASLEIATAAQAPPLCVDLDGTLIRTDLLWESVVSALRHCPWLLLAIPFRLLRGRAFLKQELARRVSIDVASLPYNPELMS
jgi:hypothetical protein